jgi:hypothetical protein
MKVTVNVAQVSDIVDIASRFVARNATPPINIQSETEFNLIKSRNAFLTSSLKIAC